jgi:hypothetical protein
MGLVSRTHSQMRAVMTRIHALQILLLCSSLSSCRPSSPPMLTEIGQFNTSGWAHDIALEGNCIYVSDRQGGYLIFDRSRGFASPTILSPVQDVISLAPNSGKPLLAARFEGLTCVSASGQVIGRFANGDIANAVETRGGLAYVAFGLHGLVIARLTDTGPRLVAELPSPGWSHGLKLAGNRALLADWNYGLRIVDVRDPARPVESAVLPTPATTIAIAVKEQSDPPVVALAEGHGGIAIAALEGDGTPVPLGRNPLGLNPADEPHPEKGGWAHGVAWAGSYLFVANWKRGLALLDARDPRHPVLMTEVRTGGTALAVATAKQPDGSHLVFLADGESGLHVYRFARR